LGGKDLPQCVQAYCWAIVEAQEGENTKRSKVVHYGYACDKREMMGKREA
jgi:hypothetical protein